MKKRLYLLIAALAFTSSFNVKAAPVSENVEAVVSAEEVQNEDLHGHISLPSDYEVPSIYSNLSNRQIQSLNRDFDSLPSSYRTTKLPLTRNQNPFGSCWAHGANALAEIDMMNNHGASTTSDYSEFHTAYFTYNSVVEPLMGNADATGNLVDKTQLIITGGSLDFLDLGGNYNWSSNTMLNWCGAVDESVTPYPAVNGVKRAYPNVTDSMAYTNQTAHLQNVKICDIVNDRDSAKKLIMEYGAVGIAYASERNSSTYNSTYKAYYNSATKSSNHEIVVVGWDDDFSASKFVQTPEGNGAWLCRNSWNTGSTIDDMDYNSYFWMSYYEKTLVNAAYAFDVETVNNYDNVYFYDNGLFDGNFTAGPNGMYSVPDRFANVFTAKASKDITKDNSGVKGEYIRAAGVGIGYTNIPYTVKVYTNLKDSANPCSGTLETHATTKGTTTYAGYYTIPLESPVFVKEGEKFAIVLEMTGKDGQYISYERSSSMSGSVSCGANLSYYTIKSDCSAAYGESFYYFGGKWTDNATQYNMGNFRIKAYTTNITNLIEPTGIRLVSTDKYADNVNSYMEISKSQTTALKPVFLPENTTIRDVIYSSSNEKIATVDSRGNVTGAGYGTAKITVKYRYDNNVSATYTVKVTKKLTAFELAVTDEELSEHPGVSDCKNTYTVGDKFKLEIDAVLPEDTDTNLKLIQYEDVPNFKSRALKLTRCEDGSAIVECIAPGAGTITADILGATAKFDYVVNPNAGEIDAKLSGDRKTVELTVKTNSTADSYTVQKYYNVSGLDGKPIDTSYELVKENLTPVKDGQTFTLTDKVDCERLNYITYKLISSKSLQHAGAETYGDLTNEITTEVSYDYLLNYYTTSQTIPYLTVSRNGLQKIDLSEIKVPGYDFKGWYTSAGFSGNPVTEGSIKNTYQDINLYGKYELKKYKVTFNPAGGKLTGKSEQQLTVKDAFADLPAAESVGLIFTGWYTTEGGRIEAGSMLPKADDITLYARYDVDPNYKGFITIPTASDMTAREYKYTAAAITPEVKVFYNGVQLVSGVDYTIKYVNNKNVASFDSAKAPAAVITGKGNYTGQAANLKFSIVPAAGGPLEVTAPALKGYKVAIAEDGYNKSVGIPYTGKEICPAVKVYKATKTDEVIMDDQYYVVTYSNNVNAGKGSILVTSRLDNKTVIKSDFKIAKVNLTADNTKVDFEDSVSYNKVGAVPEMTVSVNGIKLLMGRDYTVKALNNKKTGTATFTITGKGNYSGTVASKTFVYNVSPKDLSNATVVVSNIIEGKKILANKVIVIDEDGTVLGNKDYEVVYALNSAVLDDKSRTAMKGDDIEVYIRANSDNYRGRSEIKTVNVVGQGTMKVTLDKTKVSVFDPNNPAKCPDDIVSSCIYKLKDGTEIYAYRVEDNTTTGYMITGFSNNFKKGNGSAYVLGTGENSGMVKINYKILPAVVKIDH